ncbi:MAG: hypothetical protein ABSA18_09325 [Dehalococcoidia bacterium]
MSEKKPEIMQRKVGLLETVAMIVGLVIGAAIFVLLPTMTSMTGPSVFLALGLWQCWRCWPATCFAQ